MSGHAKELILMLDNPCEHLTEDGLGLDSLSETIAGAAMGNKGPFTIGVFGEWGQGKTSLLRLSHGYIKDDEKVVSTWFNAWQHEREKEPLFPLIASILDAIDAKFPPPANLAEAAKDKAGQGLRKIHTTLRALARGMKFSGEISVPLLAKAGFEFDAEKAILAEEILSAQTNPLQGEMLYSSAFRLLGEQAAAVDGMKIIVFIDDLDRCDPESAVRLLESIKLILWQPGFVFVLALDESIITTYLTKQYVEKHGLEKDKNWGEFYLQKIINLQLRVPRHTNRFEKYTQKQVETLIKNYKQNPDNPTSPELIALKAATGAIAVGAEQNPRAFVRLVNQFLVNCRLWSGMKGKSKDITRQVAMAIAIDKTLNAKLGEKLSTTLADSNNLCEEVFKEIGYINIGKDPRRQILKDSLFEEETAVSEDNLNTTSILRIICQARNQPLLTLLIEEGEEWFTNHQLRGEVRDFLSAFDEDTEVNFPPIIAEAVRSSLGIGPHEPILRSALSSLTHLFLAETKVTDDGIKSLEKLTELTELYLYDTQITDAGIKSLEKLTTLTNLGLQNTKVTDEGIKSLEKLTALTDLSLSDTQVTDEGIKSIEKLNALTDLYLMNTLITDEGIKGLEKLTALRLLDLDDTGVTDQGIKSLEKLCALTTLYLKNTGVTDQGMQSLEKLTVLTSLDLRNTQVTDEGIKSLAKLTALRILLLNGTKVTAEGIKALKQALPDCRLNI